MPVSYCCHQIMWTALESLVSLLRIKRWEGTDHLYWRESGCSTSERKATRENLNWWRALLPSTSAIPPRGKTLWHCLQTQFNFELLQIRIFFFSWNRIFQKLFCWFCSSLFIWICYLKKKKGTDCSAGLSNGRAMPDFQNQLWFWSHARQAAVVGFGLFFSTQPQKHYFLT